VDLTCVARAGTAGAAIGRDDFDFLAVVGKGSFGKVFLVRKRSGGDAGAVYALKSLRKEVLLRRNQIEHTKTERAILQSVSHPFIVALRYAFQTQDKLYLVTGACGRARRGACRCKRRARPPPHTALSAPHCPSPRRQTLPPAASSSSG
jgi:hypothetical protein